MSLLDVLRGVMLHPAEQAAYNANPGAYLERYGYEGVDAADLSEAFDLVADTLTPEQARAWEDSGTAADTFGADTADFDSEPGAGGTAPAPDEIASGGPEAGPDPGPGAGADDPAVPALSFGEGVGGTAHDLDDLDDLSFDEAAAGVDGLAGTADVDAAGLPGTDDLQGGTGAVDLTGELDHGVDEVDDVDEMDDLGAIDELDELGGLGGGAGGADIGSF